MKKDQKQFTIQTKYLHETHSDSLRKELLGNDGCKGAIMKGSKGGCQESKIRLSFRTKWGTIYSVQEVSNFTLKNLATFPINLEERNCTSLC